MKEITYRVYVNIYIGIGILFLSILILIRHLLKEKINKAPLILDRE